jgi:predicted Zn-dependent peptidase
MLDRTLAPPFNRSTSFVLIEPEKEVTRNGAEIFFVLGGSQEVCKVELIFPAGRWFEKTWGASYFSSQLLSKGTKTKSSFEIAELFDGYGAHLEINAGMDLVSVSLYSLNKNLEPSLLLLMELLKESVFPEKELALLKSIYLQNLKVNREKTSFLASTLIRKKIYGDSHPYGKELEEAEVTSLSRDILDSYYKEFFNVATIIVSGRVSTKHKQFVQDIFAPFALNPLKSWQHNSSEVVNDGARHLVAKDGSVQSSVRVGKTSIGRRHEDYPGVLFLNHILGGYFGSRLMKNIREEKGLSYGISSSVHTMVRGNHMVIGADVNRENLDITFDEIRKELKRLRTEKISASELETARNHFIGSLQLEITTSFAHADKLKNILIFNLPPDYYQKLIARTDSITAEELMQVAEKYFSEESFIEVAVG